MSAVFNTLQSKKMNVLRTFMAMMGTAFLNTFLTTDWRNCDPLMKANGMSRTEQCREYGFTTNILYAIFSDSK